MSKLFKLKDWLTLAEAARHLTLVFDEDVGEADILRLALDGRLKLSVNLVNGGKVRVGKIVPIDEAKYVDLPSFLREGGATVRHYRGPKLWTEGKETHVVELGDDVVSLRGVFDLPMIGNEKFDIEHRFQMLTGGPEITLHGLDGAFVEAEGDVLCQLQDQLSIKERKAIAEFVRQNRRIDSEEPDASDGLKLLESQSDAQKYVREQKSRETSEDFYPAGGLPANCAVIVRTNELVSFVRAINGEVPAAEKDLTTRERDTLLKLVIGMAIKGYGHDPLSLKSPAPKEIESDLAQLGLNVTDDTVRKYLKQAAVTVLPEGPRQH